jgi:hypothetical protein
VSSKTTGLFNSAKGLACIFEVNTEDTLIKLVSETMGKISFYFLKKNSLSK